MPLWLPMLYRDHPPNIRTLIIFGQISSQPMQATQQACQPPMQTDFSKMQNQEHCQQLWQDSHQQQKLQVHENTVRSLLVHVAFKPLVVLPNHLGGVQALG